VLGESNSRRDEFTLFTMDRRGFGASRDGSGYSAEREFSDVAAVVEAVAARAGQLVVLFGSSWGANCALGAARDLLTLRALILYEPSLGRRHAPGSLDRIEERIAAGDSEGVLIEIGTEAGLTEARIAERRTAPTLVPARRRRPHGRPRGSHLRGLGLAVRTLRRRRRFYPAPHRVRDPHGLAEITSMTAAAISGAQVHILAGHGHFAHVSDPGLVAQVLRDRLE
jgi:pimeloyl-ACP methyl ester carboxylesterase